MGRARRQVRRGWVALAHTHIPEGNAACRAACSANSLVRTITYILERLPVLEDDGNFGELATIDGLPLRVRAKQLRALEGLLGEERRG